MDSTLILTIIIFLVGLILAYSIGVKVATMRRDNHWQSQIPIHRQDAIAKSRAVLSGNFSEQLAPYMPDFPFKATEVRFLGKPIDFIAFNGLDEKNVREVVFVEVKSGKAQLNKTEKSLRDAIKKKKVRFEEYRVPDDVVGKD